MKQLELTKPVAQSRSRLAARWYTLLLLICGAYVFAAPKKLTEAFSPERILKVALSLDDGRIAYSVSRLNEPIILPSRLGLMLQGQGKFERDFEFIGSETRDFDETWEQPWGEQRLIRNHYRELRARFRERLLRRELVICFRLFDDGFAFRYEVPKQRGMKELLITEDLSEFHVRDQATAWWIPAGEWNRYEYLYERTRLDQVSQAHTPITIRTKNGLHLSFHEAALVDYPSMWLRRATGQVLRAQLAPSSDGIKARRSLPFQSPWRTVQVADHAGGLVESYLILNLNEPNKLGDVAWVKPAKYVGIWWSLHLDQESWATGPKHGATTANTKRMIDFAAEHGFRGVLVEGWNVGWDGQWFGNGWDFSFTQAAEDFDLEALAQYAVARGVHLVGHHETGCAVSHYERQLKDAMALYGRLGVDQVKTGYVCDAGQIERQDRKGGPVIREWHDGRWMSNHHLRVLLAAAKERISINAHEPIKDTGLRRTYPNWLAREGARGGEYNAWGQPPNPPEHEANLIFTRMLSGPMDFTPGIVSLKGRGGAAIESTLAKQLALYVVLYSPIQMAADLPEHYLAEPEAFEFIKSVPVDWEQSLVLAGEIGDFAVIARQQRSASDWYLGGVTDEHARVLPIALHFLAPGKKYRAEIYRDGDNAHYRSNPKAFAREQLEVDRHSMLKLKMAPGGGVAIRLSPLD
jgi:alpha-glucosidase